MSLDFSKRSPENELMDDFTMSGDILYDSLEQIANVNRYLGGNTITLNGISKLIKNQSEPIKIIDIGCGGGHMCRNIAKWAIKKQYSVQILGIDANQATIDYAKKTSSSYKNIDFQCADVFDSKFNLGQFDVVVLTLTLHHFSDQQILDLMKRLNKNAKVGIVINDLHRCRIAYQLFQLVCQVFGLNQMIRNDGSISILSGFKRKELANFSKLLQFRNDEIQWRWAFRYQWIIPKS